MAMRKERWREELDAAGTEKDVLNIVRDYVALMTSEEVSALPDHVKPGAIRTAEEVAEWAFRLVHEQLSHIVESQGAVAVQDMCEFFAAAAAKMTEVKLGIVKPAGR